MRKFSPRFRLPKKRRKLWIGLAAVVLLTGLAVLVAPWWVDRATASAIYQNINQVPARPVGIVFGAGVTPNGELSPVLRARVAAGVELYKAGKVQKLLMTGDNGRINYNEVTPMKEYAVAHGVPPQNVVRDYAGFHTFDSCYRARHVFQIDRAILVTQAFHLPRAVYLARAMGIDAVGYVAPDDMDSHTVSLFERRERWTILGSLIDLHDGHRPTYPGPVDPLFGDNSPNR